MRDSCFNFYDHRKPDGQGNPHGPCPPALARVTFACMIVFRLSNVISFIHAALLNRDRSTCVNRVLKSGLETLYGFVIPVGPETALSLYHSFGL